MKKKSYPVFVLTMPHSKTEMVLATHRNVEVPSKIISVNKAINDYNNFFDTRIANDPTDRTRAIWFDLEMLQDYLGRIDAAAEEKGIEITRLAFLLGADKNNKRTVFMAPMTFDDKYDIHRAFSIDNDKVTFINRFPIEKHSPIEDSTGLHNADQSLVLSENGPISSAEAIELYNNYFDSKIEPHADTVEADTRFVYYDKGVFEEYIGYLNLQADKTNTEVSGLNIVFTVYDNNITEGLYANHLNLFFAPTEKGSERHISFMSFDPEENGHLDFSRDRFEFTEKTIISSYFNRGGGAPPPYHWD